MVDLYRLRSTVLDGWYKMVENNVRERIKRQKVKEKRREQQ